MNALHRILALSTPLLGATLGACAIGTSFPNLAASGPPDQPVVLVLTRVVVDIPQRAEFDRQNGKVMDSMGAQPGLLGYSARRELFGPQGWTMSVWASDEARAAFVRSAVHREAIARSAPAIVTVELKRVTLARKDLPRDWDAALRMLDDPVGRRSYLE